MLRTGGQCWAWKVEQQDLNEGYILHGSMITTICYCQTRPRNLSDM